MKKVTTNITFGQILFILLTGIFSSLMAFYLGAKFGRNVFNINSQAEIQSGSMLPDEKLAQEIKDLISQKKQGFLFHDVLQNKELTQNLKAKEIIVKKQDTLIPSDNLDAAGDLTTKDSSLTFTEVSSDKDKTDTKTAIDSVVVQKTGSIQTSATTVAKTTDANAKTTDAKATDVKPTDAKLGDVKSKQAVVKQIDQIPVKMPVSQIANATINDPLLDDDQSLEAAQNKIMSSIANSGTINKEQKNLAPKGDGVATQAKDPHDLNSIPTEETNIPPVAAAPTVYYGLQLDSFSESAKAEKAKLTWQKRGYDVNVVASEIQGKGTWYRLCVGRYETKTAVTEAQKQIMQKFKSSSRVIEIQN